MFFVLLALIAMSILVYFCPDQQRQPQGNLDYTDKVLLRDFHIRQRQYFERNMTR